MRVFTKGQAIDIVKSYLINLNKECGIKKRLTMSDYKALGAMYEALPEEDEPTDINQITGGPELIFAALDFVNKVDAGRAKSTDSYNKFKEALKKAGILK